MEKAAGKLDVALTEADVSAILPSNRLSVTDRKSGYRFLIDTGANISVLPRERKDNSRDNTYKLYAANGTEIRTYGERTLTLDLKMRRPYRWTFVVADVKQPILGADFLEYHNILVDMSKKKLIDGKTGLLTPGTITQTDVPSIRTINSLGQYAEILEKYPNITKPMSGYSEPRHGVVHQIITEGHPVYSKCRPLPADKYKKVKQEIENMLDSGICRPSKSPWASPLHVAKKKNGDLRLCGDYRKLNAITKPDRYPIPRLLDFTYLLPGSTIYSRIDLQRAYNQIPVQEVEKTAVITPFGLFEFPRMPFGLRNAGQTFVRFLNTVLSGLNFIFAYIDDILIVSKSEEEHKKHLEEVFSRLNENCITINLAKCEFGKSQIEFLGYLITRNGYQPLPEKVKAIAEYPQPKTVHELRRFLGMLNFYRNNIPNAAKYQAHLNSYLCASKKRDKTLITWTQAATEAFNQCKDSLKNAIILSSPSTHTPISLMTDASQTCVGAVLQQYEDNTWKPLAFFSKSLSDAQQNYSTYDRELLAIYMAVTHFQPYVEGRELIIYTDHKPLCHAFKPRQNGALEKTTPRRLRHLEYIAQFTTDIRHLAGSENPVADALSRIAQIDCPTPLDWNEIAQKQQDDQELQPLLEKENLRWKIVSLGTSSKLYCENSTHTARPYVPNQLRKQVFDTMHGVTHPGTRASRKLIKEHFFWPNMNRDVGRWAKACVPCQKSKIYRHNSTPYGSFLEAARLEHIHCDIVGPLPPSENNRYIVTIIDRATRWPEAVPVPEITASVVANAIVNTWISRFGCPSIITTDQGRQFESDLFTSLSKLLGIKKTRTTSYHPQSNGIVERWHRTMKAALMARGNTINWCSELPIVLLGLRTALRDTYNVSPAQMLYGTNIRIPGEFFEPQKQTNSPEKFTERLQRVMSRLSPQKAEHHDAHKPFVHPEMKTCEYVFVKKDAVKKPLTPPYEGPFKVLEKHEKFYKVQLSNRTSIISINRLKPAFIINEQEVNDRNTFIKTNQRHITEGCNASNADNDNNMTPKITRSGRIVRPVVRFNY